MKDISSLFLTAKASGSQKDALAYSECIQDLYQNKPSEYITKLEYIIQSNTGLNTFDSFIEKYGLPICAYDHVMQCFEKCIDKCKTNKKDSSKYEEEKEKLESFKKQYKNCFLMYEYYQDKLDPKYFDTYYGFNENGIQKKKLMAGMINQFGESAIPDIIITADKIGDTAIYQTVKYIESSDKLDGIAHELISESFKDINIKSDAITEKALSPVVMNMIQRHNAQFTEAMAVRNDNAEYDYTESEINAIQDLISLYEYQVLCLEDADEKQKLQNTIYSLYEELDGVIDECGNIINYNEGKILDKIKEVHKKNKEKRGVKSEVYDRFQDLVDHIAHIVKGEINYEIKGFNNKARYFDRLPTDPSITVTVGNDREDIYGLSAARTLVDVMMADKSEGDFFENLFLFINIEFKTKSSLTRGQKTDIRKILVDSIKESCTQLVNNKKIALDLSPEVHSAMNDDVSGNKRTTTNTTTKTDADGNVVDKKVDIVNEYKTTWTYKIYVNKSIKDDIDFSVFESSDIDEETADSVIPMLPANESESLRHVNTRNKFSGEAPTYLSSNHNLKYGEDDSDEDKTLDDYRRASADDRPESDDDQVDEPDVELDDTDGDTDTDDKIKTNDDDNRAINNYYYYTYTNSLNRVSNSHNQANRDNHSVTSSDDHSMNKGSNRDNNRNNRYGEDTLTEGLFDIFNRTHNQGDPAFSKANANAQNEINQLKSKGISDKIIRKLTNDVPNHIEMLIDDWKVDDANDYLKLQFDVVPGKVYDDSGTNIGRDFQYVPMAAYYFSDQISPYVGNIIYGGKQYPDIPETEAYIGFVEPLQQYINSYAGELDDKPTGNILADIRKYNIKGKKIYLKSNGQIGFELDSDIDPEHEIGINYDGNNPEHRWTVGQGDTAFESVAFKEDASDQKPESDHPIKDTAMDIDRSLGKVQQGAKRKVQNVINAGTAITKPVKRTYQWITKLVYDYKDKDENRIKEDMADPKKRSGLMKAFREAIRIGALAKAGLLLNPVFMYLNISNKMKKNDKEKRIRREIIGELRTELDIMDEKIEYARSHGDQKNQYQLMRLKNELQKKLVRVSGDDSGGVPSMWRAGSHRRFSELV